MPADFDAPDGQPCDHEAREYSHVRGAGDGRVDKGADPSRFQDLVLNEEEPEAVPASILADCSRCGGQGWFDSPENTCLICDGTGQDDSALGLLGVLGGKPVRQGGKRASADDVPAALPNTEDRALIPSTDVRSATSLGVLLVLVCVLAQPLVLAHADGFTTLGMELPQSASRSQCMGMVQGWLEAACSHTSYYAFLIGEYVGGARLFTAPIDFAPAPHEVVRTPAQRRSRWAAGATFV